jgi:membrane-associated phospholipid phosphatase
VGAYHFAPFTRNESLPSGHTVMAFARATSLADEARRGWLTAGLHTLAAGTALGRLNDNRHWVSDVGLGALVGVSSAKLVSGRWRVFGLSPPRFLAGSDGTVLIVWQQPL